MGALLPYFLQGRIMVEISFESILTAILDRALAVVVIILVTLVVTKLVKSFFLRLARNSTRVSPLICSVVRKTINFILWVCTTISLLYVFGINVTPIITGLGVTGVVLGFALQESVSSFFSGFLIAVTNPFRIGDYVDIDSVSGTVVSMDLLSVTLGGADNRKITLSNKTVWGSVIVNYSDIEKRRMDMVVQVAYNSDIDKVKQVIKGLISSYPEILENPAPVVELSKLNDSSLDFVVRPWVKPENYWPVYWRFQQDIVEALRKENIEIPYDKLDVNIISKS